VLPLRSDRLVIRMMRPADAPRLVGYRNDPAIGIEWPDLGQPPLLAAKDAAAPALAQADAY